jgi:alpha-beta hydrolase superfamily lysophospholipase
MIPFLSIRMARSIIIAIERAFKNASSFKTPIILFHGKNDSVANYKSTMQFFERLGSLKKNLKIFDNGYH